MTDQLRFHSIAELRDLATADLRALWELVPTDRQRAYRAAYEREITAANAAGSDERERQIARALLKRYHEAALVPIGARWARTPGRVQSAAQQDASLTAAEPVTAASAGKPSRLILGGLGVLLIGMIGLMVLRGGSTAATVTVTATPNGTPTPLALEAQDDVIAGGDAGRSLFYPINLQITAPDAAAPRVWVVQRRAVRAAQWNFDANPDTASFLNGMSVRPVIGIPWSEENAAWFDQLDAGTTFRVQMNTGAILTFTFEDKRAIRRSDTGIFRQVSPGLVLLLIGETDADGLPTASRTLVTAAYDPAQELGRAGELIGAFAPVALTLPTPEPVLTPTPIQFAGLDVQVIAVTTQPGALTARVRLYNAGDGLIAVTSEDVWLALGYAERPAGPRLPADGLPAFDLLPGQAADLALTWSWTGEPFGTLGVGAWRFSLMLES